MSDKVIPQKFRVPREDGSLLCIPDLESASRLVQENRFLFASSPVILNGRPLNDLRIAARRDAVAQARAYTASLIQSELPEFASDSLVISGHQPELFHVGVWAKNFAIAHLAKRNRSVAINLVIDNDTLNSTSIRVPSGSREQLRVDRVLFDSPRPSLPWEEAMVLDAETFQRFGVIVRNHIRSTWDYDPLIGTAWDSAAVPAVDSRLCDHLTAFRVRVERSWGLTNLELPMSRLCETEPFRWFASHLLMQLPELHRIYNESVAEYRREHRLRNRMQPVPDLESDGDWLEAPFWIWRSGDSQRGRLFARRTSSVCELRDQKDVLARLSVTEDGSLESAVEGLSELSARGYRLRTRALTTTLFARTCLADLFVHGIGGAKYDAMTDRICERLFGIKAPTFLTVSATLHLPLGGPYAATVDELRENQHKLRDLTYNPDRHLTSDERVDLSGLMAEKNEILAAATLLRESKQLRGRLSREQHQRLLEIRSQMNSLTASKRAEYESTVQKLRSQLSSNTYLKNREYSFVLYPEERLKQFLEKLEFRL